MEGESYYSYNTLTGFLTFSGPIPQKEKQVSEDKKTSEQTGKEDHQHSINHEGREPGSKGKY